MIDAAEFILSEKPEAVAAVSIDLNESVEKLRAKITNGMKAVDQKAGVLILTDMFGGTPANLCFSLLEDTSVEVLTGMNLPMILKILSARREASLAELARIAMECGRENIYLAREILEQRERMSDENRSK